ncbi:MAG: xanthine dehydrogenase family protein molybdopterin-binding subunit [Betaproteobacteria bacterium]
MNPMRMRPPATPQDTMSRRVFLKSTAAAGAGLTLGLYFGDAVAQMSGPGKTVGTAAIGMFEPNAFLRVGRDNTVTVVVKHLEMGQGVYTGLPTLIAEELDAAWSQVRVEGAPADASRYNNLLWGPAQGTGGSTAMANSYEQYRQAGAAARAMLVAAAAGQWKVGADSVQVKNGVVFHASGKKATYGELAEAAGRQPVPANVKLKDAKDFVYIGKHVPRTDSKAKSNGTARFTQDLKLPDMLTAVVAHAPRFGQKLARFDSAGVTGIPGVRYVVEIPNGVAVIATTFWAAKKGRDALKVEWDETTGFRGSSDAMMAEYVKLAATPGASARKDGDAGNAIGGAAKKLEASFEFPYLAHAAMEPMNCVVKLTPELCEVWNGEQFQTGDQFAIAKYSGLKPEQIKLNMLYAGGSFGRRASATSDYVLEAVSIAVALVKAGKPGIPVKMVWTREDDMKGGYYRPMYVHALRAGIDASGNIVGWHHRIVGQSILAGTAFESMMVKDGIDLTSVEGASTLPYSIPHVAVELHSTKVGVPVLWWRSVGSTHTAYSTETFIDELAVAAGKDPVDFRRGMLAKHPRHLAALELAADKAGWGKPLPAGKAGEKRGRGVAVHESFGTVVAQVAEVTVDKDSKFRVDRVVCAVHCGVAVNPDVVRAQMEGGIGFGLTAALYGKITLKDGIVEQSNFHDYPLLRINEMPAIDVHIVPSTDKPSGVGEPGVPVIAPALANALAAATGKRLRTLPLVLG